MSLAHFFKGRVPNDRHYAHLLNKPWIILIGCMYFETPCMYIIYTVMILPFQFQFDVEVVFMFFKSLETNTLYEEAQ